MILLLTGAAYANDSIVAKVNDLVFTKKDLESEVDRIIRRTTYHRNVPAEKRKNYYKRAIDELIDRELQYQDAKSRGMSVAAGDIDAQLEKFKKRFKSDKDYQAALEMEKISEVLVRARIEKELLAQEAFAKNVTEPAKVSDSYLKEHYDKNAAKFKAPDSVKLRIISVRDAEKARDILEKIKQGADFGEMAYNFSEDSYRMRGGETGYLHKGRMLKEIDEVAFNLKAGEVSDIIRAESSHFILRVEDKKPEHQVAFEDTKEKLRMELESERAGELKKKWMDGLKSKAKIEILLKTE